MNHQPTEALRLPLWKNCYERMIADGCDYGSTYPASFFERELKAERDSMRFNLDISEIREALEAHGFYLSGRGHRGEEWVILPPQTNADTLNSYQRNAVKLLKRGVILGTNTRLDLLTAEQRRRHERTLEKIATRAALMGRKLPVATTRSEKRITT